MIHRTIVLFCCLLFWAALPGFAQDTAGGQDTSHRVTLSREKLLIFEGIFTNEHNPDQSAQFTADTNCLKAKMLWTDVTLTLYPRSDLEFFSRGEEPVNITFAKDPDGKVEQLKLNDRAVWRRNRDYHPFVLKEAKHTPAQLKPYEGLFTMNGGFIRLFEKDNQLILKQLWDGNEIPFVPDTAWNFYGRKNILFNLHFTMDANGQPTQFLAFKRDLWVKAKPAHYNPADLKVFEGKYHLDVDSDDVVQISASGTDLVIKQLWDGKSTTVSPTADLFFYNPAESFTLSFTKNGDGKITEALGPNNNHFIKIQ
jgi:hypothetical protein